MNVADMVVAKINEISDVSKFEDLKTLINECGIEAINKSLDKKGTTIHIEEKPFEIFKYLHESAIYTSVSMRGNPLVSGKDETVNYLLNRGFDINYENELTENALFGAGKKRALYLIEKGIDVHAQNNFCQNTLFHAKSTEVLEKLIQRGVSINHIDYYGQNALFFCNTPGKINLLIRNGIDTSQRNTDGVNFVYNYYENNKKESADIIKTGLKEKIDVLEEYPEKTEKNLLFLLEDINLLRKYQTLFTPIVNSINKDQENALFLSAGFKKSEILISMGIDVNHKNEGGETVLFNRRRSLPEVKALVAAGIDINTKNKKGYNALHNISNIHIKEYLILSGIDYSQDREEYMGNKLLNNAIMKMEITHEKNILSEFTHENTTQKLNKQRL